ncbi:hypothetical protein VI817_004504 [Penicillium citrinum]|nr:hypothetical protein VI817_004504 [Penicillium citrinum]
MIETTGQSGVYDCANGFDPWVFHMQAMNTLLKENQPEVVTNPLIHVIASGHAKLTIIYGILAERGPGGSTDHLTKSNPESPLDELFEMFTMGQSFAETIEFTRTLPMNHPGASPKSCLALLKTIVDFRNKLIAWYTEREEVIGGAPTLCEEKDLKKFNKKLTEISPFEQFYRFSSMDNARIHLLYWTAMNVAHMLVYRAQMNVVYANASALPTDFLPVDPSSYEDFVLARYYIDQVCRAIPYCMQPMNRIWGTHVVFGTIGNVFRSLILSRSREKFLWCQRVLEIAGKLGLEMALYFLGVANREWDAMEGGGEPMVRSPTYAGSPDSMQYSPTTCSSASLDETFGSPGSDIDCFLHVVDFQDLPMDSIEVSPGFQHQTAFAVE